MTDTDITFHDKQRRRLFLGGPFKALVDPVTGVMAAAEQQRITGLIKRLEHAGFEVHNAHKREGWGAEFMSPEECTRLDFTQIRDCDVFVAYPGDPASPGTHVEIGWAAAFGKPIVLLLKEGGTYAFLVRGLHTVADVTYVRYRGDEDIVDEVAATVERVMERTAAAAEV